MSKYAVSFFAFGRKTFFVLGAVLLVAASGFVADSVNAQTGTPRTVRMTSGGGNPGGTVALRVELDAQGNETSLVFSFGRNQAVLTNPVITLGNGVPAGTGLTLNESQAAQGLIGVIVDTPTSAPYTAGTKTVLNITFTIAANAATGNYPVVFGNVPTPSSLGNTSNGLIPINFVNGNVQVGSTAAGVDVSGRVLTPDGRGIRNAKVIVTDAAGNKRVATTGSFGFYRFADIESGQAYTISVASKQYRFTPRVINLVDSLVDFDFVGQQ